MKKIFIIVLLVFVACKKSNSTLIPIPSDETRSLAAGWGKDGSWMQQHQFINAVCESQDSVDLLMIGNSITQSWGSENRGSLYGLGSKIRKKYFKDYKVINAGIAGDRVEHILWRLQHGTFEKCHPKNISLAIGVNNFKFNDAQEIAEGTMHLIKVIHDKFPKSKLIVFGLLPTGIAAQSAERKKYDDIQRLIAKGVKAYPSVSYHNAIKEFTLENQDLNPQLYAQDGIHLQEAGYETWAEILLKLLDKWN